jgi:hypothetical protein
MAEDLTFAPKLDDTYRTALADRENKDALDWLMQDAPAQGDQPNQMLDGDGEAPAEGGGVLDTAKAVGSDVLTGVTSDAANVVVGGPMKALQETFSLMDPLVRWIDENTPMGAVSEAVGLEDFSKPGPDGKPKEATLPNIGGVMDRPESVTGGVLQAITQFLTGFGMAGKVVKAGGTAATLGKAAISDFAAFDGQEGNLANLLQMLPALQNPVSEYLATDENTPEMEGRLKNTLANFIPSAVLEPVLMGLRAVKEARRVKALTGAETYQDAATKLAQSAEARPQAGGRVEEILGNPSDDLVRTVDTALAETETGVPQHVAAKALAEAKGAHKAEDIAPGMKRMYTVERDGQPIAPETDDLAAAQAAIKAEGGTQGQTHQIVYRDVPVEGKAAPQQAAPPPLPGGLSQVKGIRVFHGSPHDFDRFDLSKIGTGEGAQAYGHGLYFAENEGVARSYRDALSQNLGLIDGKPASLENPAHAAAIAVKGYGDEASAIARSELARDAAQRDGNAVEAGRINKIIEHLKGRTYPDLDKGRMYEVRINAEPEQFLDWDKPLGQQPPGVQSAFEKMFEASGVPRGIRDIASKNTIGDALDTLGFNRASAPEVSATLKEQGIPGIRYLDQGSRGKGEGSYNYVVFDDSLIEIVGKDGKPMKSGPELDEILAKVRSEMNAERPDAETGNGGAGQPPEPPPPPAGGGNPPAPKGPPFSREVFVNWARIDTPDDVKQVIGQMADAMAPEISARQRGVRTNKTTTAAAGDENAWKILIGERKGNLPTAEEQLALRQLWASSGEKLMETAKLAQTGDAEAMFAFRRMMAVHNMIQQEVLGIRTETARALQQWRIPAGGGAEKMKQLEFALRNHGGLEVSQSLAQRIAVLAEQPGMAGALDQMVRKGATAKTMDAVREVWINAILSGPKTHIVNMMSNSAVVAQSIVERAVAGRIGSILNPVDGVKIGEAQAMAFGVRMAMRDALRNAWKTMQTGESGFGMGQIEGPRTRALSSEAAGVEATSLLGRGLDMMGSVVNVPGRALTASDEFFKSINYRAELWAQAFRTASEEVERGTLKRAKLKDRMAEIIMDPPEDIRLKAADLAAYNTFTSTPGKVSQQLMKLRNTLDETTGTPIGTMLIPFINTPGNIMKYTFERTPLAPLMSRFRADMAAGGARRDLALARMGLGTITMLTALDLAMDGHLTGRGPAGKGQKDAGERQAMARVGWQKYSVRVPTKYRDGKPTDFRYYAFNRADPVGGQLAMAAEIAEAINNSDGMNVEGISEVLSAGILGASQVYMNKSYFSGLTKFMDALQDPERYGEGYFNGLVESFIPTGVAEVARSIDPVQRHVTDMTDALMKRTPGLSKSLSPRLDYWGQPIEYSSGLGSTYDALSPIYSRSTETAEPIDKEFFKLNYFPTHAASIRVDGGTVSLRNMPKARNALVELTAATKASKLLDANEDALLDARKKSTIRDLEALGDLTLKEALNGIVTNTNDELVQHFVRRGSETESYFEADADEKQKIISDVIGAYRQAATLQVIREFPEISERRALQPSREEAAPGLPY